MRRKEKKAKGEKKYQIKNKWNSCQYRKLFNQTNP